MDEKEVRITTPQGEQPAYRSLTHAMITAAELAGGGVVFGAGAEIGKEAGKAIWNGAKEALQKPESKIELPPGAER